MSHFNPFTTYKIIYTSFTRIMSLIFLTNTLNTM